MNTGKQIPPSEPTRQEKLFLWFKREKKSQRDLAAFAGVSPAAVNRWTRAEALPFDVVEVMQEFGIPEAYLPQPVRRFGPHKGSPVEATAQA